MTAADPQRFELRTADRDLAEAAFNRVTPHRARISFAEPADVDCWIRSASYGEFSADLLRFGGVTYSSEADPIECLLSGFVAGGAARVRLRGEEVVLPGGQGFLYPVGVASTGDYGDTDFVVIRIPVAYAAQVAEELTGLPEADLRFESMTPLSEPMRRFWVNTADFIGRQLVTRAADQPSLLVEEMKRMVATALLAAFPNTTMTAYRTPGAGRVAPTVVRRAMIFIEAHADEPLTVARIAAAAGIGVRALQTAFRLHLGRTPLEYLRLVRLDRIHRELRDADPAGGLTVTEVARRWGFASPRRFAGLYRGVYGTTPSRTLRER